MNCEFCKKEIPGYDRNVFVIGMDSSIHVECFKMAIGYLAKERKKNVKAKVNVHPRGNYLVIKDPNSTQDTRPRQHYETYKQARIVAEDLALKSGDDFWVMRHVSTISIC